MQEATKERRSPFFPSSETELVKEHSMLTRFLVEEKIEFLGCNFVMLDPVATKYHQIIAIKYRYWKQM